MTSLSEHQLLLALAALAVILVVGRGTAEIARRLGQPEVLGELFGGFILGPSVLGALLPDLFKEVFHTPLVGSALSLFSWVGAILLLMIAGMEADLGILRQKVRPGLLSAGLAMGGSVAAGTAFAVWVLGRPLAGGLFLGLVLSVTAVGVAAKILLERGVLRRDYAQVLLAAGIASEVVVWPLISVVSSLRSGNALEQGLRSALFAVLFFVVMLTVGRRVLYWAMRRVTDLAGLVDGQLSLALVLAFISAGITQALGLHALLGAFVFGVLFGQSPRATVRLKEKLQTLTVSLFAPVFFVLAGMRVDVFQLGSVAALGHVLLLLLVATVVKVGLGALGARWGGLGGWSSLLVGVGVNLKGGTDVIVAILGAELGLFSIQSYTLYAVVAMLTVLVSPPLLAYLEQKVPPSDEEMARLDREEARRRAYLSDIERIVIPMAPELLPATVAEVVRPIVAAKQQEGEICDIAELVDAGRLEGEPEEIRQAEGRLLEADAVSSGELTRARVTDGTLLPVLLEASKGHTLLAIGARTPQGGTSLTLGKLQDQIIDNAQADVLLVVHNGRPPARRVRRILVPVNGLEYSLAAGDVAAYLARAHGAELVLFNVVNSGLDPLYWHDRAHSELMEAGSRMLQEAQFRMRRLDIRMRERVRVSQDSAAEILDELATGRYQLVVMGAMDRSRDSRLHLGATVQTVLSRSHTPSVVLVSHEGQSPTS